MRATKIAYSEPEITVTGSVESLTANGDWVLRDASGAYRGCWGGGGSC